MPKLIHTARMTTTTTGTGTVTLNGTVAGHLSFNQAGLKDNDTIQYSIVEGGNVEMGRGVYKISGPTLTRIVLRSSNDNLPLNLTGSAEVFINDVAGGGTGTSPTSEIPMLEEGPGIDLVGRRVGLGGDSFLLHRSNGDPVEEFPFTTQQLDAALAAALSGNIILYPARTLTLDRNPVYTPGAEISTGAITVTAEAGVTIYGLTVGNWYAVEGFNGYWDPGVGFPQNSSLVQLSDGTGYSGVVGQDIDNQLYTTSPSFCAFSETYVGGDGKNYGRIYFQAAVTSIWVRVQDDPGQYADNAGSLSWRLRSATRVFTITVPSGIELLGMGKNSVIVGDIINNGILTNLQVIGTISGTGKCRLVYNVNKEVISDYLHAAQHQNGGSDPIKLDDLATPDNNTDLNATADRHGLLPKLSGDANQALRGDGSWGTVASGGTIIGNVSHAVCQGRLTLESGVPLSTSDQTAKTMLYWTPFQGNMIGLFNGTDTWTVYAIPEKSISLAGLTANTNYDAFMYDNSGTPALELLAWTNDTTRATALISQDGILVKSGATTRRYLGTIRITGTTGQCEDSLTKRFVWNYYNQKHRVMSKQEATASWTYAGTGYRSMNNSATNRLEFVCGDPMFVEADAITTSKHSSKDGIDGVGIGLDSTTVNHARIYSFSRQYATGDADSIIPSTAVYKARVAVGYHYLQALEITNMATATFYGASASGNQSGIAGTVEG